MTEVFPKNRKEMGEKEGKEKKMRCILAKCNVKVRKILGFLVFFRYEARLGSPLSQDDNRTILPEKELPRSKLTGYR